MATQVFNCVGSGSNSFPAFSSIRLYELENVTPAKKCASRKWVKFQLRVKYTFKTKLRKREMYLYVKL